MVYSAVKLMLVFLMVIYYSTLVIYFAIIHMYIYSPSHCEESQMTRLGGWIIKSHRISLIKLSLYAV